ncbi:MAG: SulP family inorganic anion transporter [Pseudomonadota bacterium]
MNPKTYFSNFAQRFDLSRATIRADLVAGLTVSLVVIPQSLAYAQLAGVPAYYGLYAALIPTVIGALFGSSNQLSTGPAAMTSLLTAASISPLAELGSDLFYSYAILLALVAGIFQIMFGLLRIGALINFLSNPVLIGFINAAAVIIGLSQLPILLGIPSEHTKHFMLDTAQVISHLDSVHLLSFGFGVTAIFMLLGFKKFAPKLPGILMTVAILTLLSYAIGYESMGGKVVGTVPQGLPPLSIPPLDWYAIAALAPAGLVIALISFMEAMSSCKVIAIRTRQPWDENKELIGQGLAKIGAAFSQSIPVSGSFSRSALNLASDAKTPLSSIFAAIFVLLTLMFFTSLLYSLPKSVLAAIIMMAVINLVNFQAVKNAWRASRDDGLAVTLTFFSTLAFAPYIQNGILAGIILSLSLLLYRMMRPRVSILGLHSDTTLRDAVRHKLPKLHPKLGVIRFDGDLRFMNVSYFENALLKLERENPELEYILVQSSGINGIDASGIAMLRNLHSRFADTGIRLGFSSLKLQVSIVMDRTGLTRNIGEANIFSTDRVAIDEIRRRLDGKGNDASNPVQD